MANFTTNLTMDIGKETFTATKTGNLEESYRISQVLDASDAGVTVLLNAGYIGQSTFRSAKGMLIRNSGVVGGEIMVLHDTWTDGGGSAEANPSTTTALDVTGSNAYVSYLLGAGDAIYFPNQRMTGITSKSAANARLLDNLSPDSNMYVDSTAKTTEGFADDNDTTITFDNASGGSASGLFGIGDLIRLDDEICRIVSLTSTVFTVDRGLYGTTKADHTNNTAIRFPFFNAYSNFTAATGGYDTVQTDASGRFKCTNFFGYGRNLGLVAGSISGKFYSQGYQELGMSGIKSSTESGLTASGTYKLDITVDGGTLFQDLTFILSANTKFGGSDGVIRKIQDALDVQYYTAGNLFEKKVTVAIVNGDIRFTSGQYLSTSAILLADTTDAGSFIDAAANGRIPAAAKISAPVASKLPEDSVYDKVTNIATPNIGAMFYDDGFGNISGTCRGTINYETGVFNITGCPPNAHFVVTASYGSGHSGGDNLTNATILIYGRSVNHKINTTIDIIAVR